MKKILPAALLIALLGLSACNTFHGMGEDISATGRAIQKTSD